MKAIANKRLFWFLKEGQELDLSNQANLDMYVKQIITRGRTSDVKQLLKTVDRPTFEESFHRIKNFIPWEVRRFWEEFLGDLKQPAGKNPRSV